MGPAGVTPRLDPCRDFLWARPAHDHVLAAEALDGSGLLNDPLAYPVPGAEHLLGPATEDEPIADDSRTFVSGVAVAAQPDR